MGDRQAQASQKYGIEPAKALVEHAPAQAPEHRLDARETILGASGHLAKHTELRRRSPLDVTEVAPERRSN
jgi:hypothetical protein